MANSVPTLSGLAASVTFLENTVNATPQRIDADVTLFDRDATLGGGTLTVAGLLAEDVVSIRNQGTGAGQIGFFAGVVTYQGILVGQAFGGAGGTFAVTLNANASVAAVEALIENLTYANTSDAPTAGRTLAVHVTDGGGAAAIAPRAFTERTGAANPLGIVNVDDSATPSTVDLDGDGDLDVVVGNYDGDLVYFRNVGTASAPSFAAAVVNPFGLTSVGLFSHPGFADLDGDGDPDAVVGQEDGTLSYFKNTGTATAPAFAAPLVGAFGLTDVGLGSAPSFADLDHDGDLDAVVGASNGDLFYFQNNGTATAPAFAVPVVNPFGLARVAGAAMPSFADLDHDGDLDVMVGTASGGLDYFENIGTASAPAFATAILNPFGLPNAGGAPSFADLDYDGDLDAVLGNGGGTASYFENTTPPSSSFDITITVTAESDDPQPVVGRGPNDAATFDFALVDATISFAGNSVIIDGPSGRTILVGFETFAFTDGTVNNNDGSPLIDDLFYYARYHDVWAAHVDADAHFNTSGWREGRDPDAWFDTKGYLANYTDVRAAGVNPLTHYDQFGWREGRDPSVTFDSSDYRSHYADVAVARLDPLAHFLADGIEEGRIAFADGIWG